MTLIFYSLKFSSMKHLFLLLILISCAHRNNKLDFGELPGDIPRWVYAPNEECIEEKEVCANGDAEGDLKSQELAKKNLTSIFENRSANFEFGVSNKKPFIQHANEIHSLVNKSVSKINEQLISLIEVKKKFNKEGVFYTLVSLDKSKAVEILEKRINFLDQKLLDLWRHKQRTNSHQMFALNLEREKLNEKLKSISHLSMTPIVNWSEVEAWKDSFKKIETIQIRLGQAPEWIQESLENILIDSGFQITKNETQKILKIDLSAIKEFTSESSLDKYTFTLMISHISEGAQVASISVAESVNARSQAEALLKLKAFFIEFINRNLHSLKIG